MNINREKTDCGVGLSRSFSRSRMTESNHKSKTADGRNEEVSPIFAPASQKVFNCVVLITYFSYFWKTRQMDLSDGPHTNDYVT